MKLSRPQRIDRLQQALQQAHHSRVNPTFSPHWLDAIMRDVRRQSISIIPPPDISVLVWRAASVFVFVSVVLVGSALTWDSTRSDRDYPAPLTEATLLAGEL